MPLQYRNVFLIAYLRYFFSTMSFDLLPSKLDFVKHTKQMKHLYRSVVHAWKVLGSGDKVFSLTHGGSHRIIAKCKSDDARQKEAEMSY